MRWLLEAKRVATSRVIAVVAQTAWFRHGKAAGLVGSQVTTLNPHSRPAGAPSGAI